jgi:exonuclease III
MVSTNAIRITTWNVNGIRNPFGYQPWRDSRTFPAMFDILEADIVVMQELKIQRKDLRDDMVLIDGWDCFFSLPKHRKGQYFLTRSIFSMSFQRMVSITGSMLTCLAITS